jgi:tRNA/tmRNA/rRNA uracil-C5-methylase (TrmA/RlmC/RlmD family)
MPDFYVGAHTAERIHNIAGHLVRAGYALEGLRIFDFYPQTSHIETVVRLALV